MIDYSDLTFMFGKHIVFSNASFSLPDSGLVALTGANGVGKTTLLRILGGLHHARYTVSQQRRAQYIDMTYLSLDMLTVGELIALVTKQIKTIDSCALHNTELINDVMMLTPIRTLSLGQKQRVVLAVATAMRNCDIVLLDEPFNGLDADAVAYAQRELAQIARHCTVLFATHHQEDIRNYAEYELHITDSSTLNLL